MNKFKLEYFVIGCLAVVILSLLIPQVSHGPRGESDANLQPNSTRELVRSPAGSREARGGRVRWHSAARGSGEPIPMPEAPLESVGPKSRFEELLGSLKAMEASAQPDVEQIRAILKMEAGELSAAERTDILSKAARLVAERNLDLGLELVETLDDFRDRHGFVKAIVEAVVERDPGQTAGWASRLPDAQLLQSAYNTIGMKWGQADLEACRVWAEGVSETAGRSSALEGLTWAWTLTDADAAYHWAAQLRESEMRDKVFVKMAKMVTAQNPQRGAEWALRFPEGPGRAEALDYAVFQWAGKDLQAAALWAGQIEDQTLREGGFVAVARSWSNRDPEGATVWAAQLPEGPARTSALITTARKWAEVNPVSAAQWIDQAAQTPARQDIFTSVTSALATTQPFAVEAWLNSVVDSNLRSSGEQIVALRQEHSRHQIARKLQP